MSTCCAAALLAGGRSCRPGGIDKSQLPVDGRPIVTCDMPFLSLTILEHLVEQAGRWR
ncbi:MAG TPA: hypothetical protein VIL35_15210 [Vicinamibacterales bacterium]